MPTFTVFAHPYVNQQGKVIHPTLQIKASNNFKYYTPYPNFALSLSEKPLTDVSHRSSESSANENLVRAYRVTEFADSTCLKPEQFTHKRFGNLLDRVCAAGSCDRITYWRSPAGTAFILNETYITDPDYLVNLGEQGLAARVIPNDLAPYCGDWDPTPGAKPKTTSYLICDYRNLAELKGLEICLRNAIYKSSSHNAYAPLVLVPSWNCTKGVNHD
jgi:hypothetical protein